MAGIPTELLAALEAGDLPVLARSAREMEKLLPRGERVAPKDIIDIVMRDPFFTLNVLRTISARKKSRLTGEVTTIEHAIMMFGVRPFLERFNQLKTLEDQFHTDHAALIPLRRAISRAHHAACQARDWAIQRKDMESEEVYIAAALNEIAELMLLLYAPALAAKLTEDIRRDPVGTVAAQRALLGFDLPSLHQSILNICRLPDLLCELTDPRRMELPRVLNVQLAASLARHTEFDWHSKALQADIEAVAALLHISLSDTIAHIHRSAVLAARAWQWYMAPPAARWLPLLPPVPVPSVVATTEPKFDTPQTAIAWAMRNLNKQVGLSRVVLALYAPQQRVLRGKVNVGAADSPLAAFELSLAQDHLFSRLMNKPQSVWFGAPNTSSLNPFVTGEITRVVGQGDFFASSIFINGKAFALLYADCRGEDAALDETAYQAFKQIGARLSQVLPALMAPPPAQASV